MTGAASTAPAPVFLDRNENNYGPAPACLDVLRAADRSRLSRYDRSFTRGVRSILSERLARDLHIGEDRVLLAYGAEHILKQVIQCYLPAGEKLMVPAYSWWYYKRIASEVGGATVEFPMAVAGDSFRYDVPAALDVFRRERPAVVFLSSPNNPTGNSIARADLESLLGSLEAPVVVVDEAYLFRDGGGGARDLVERFPRLLVVRTMSKYYALAGLRIGYALMGNALTGLATFGNRYLGFNRLSEEVAIAALDSPGYYSGVARSIEADKQVYYRELARLPGFRVFRSDANFLLVEIPSGDRAELKASLERRGLFIKFMDEPALASHVRITIGTREENRLLLEAVKAFYD